MGIFDGLRPKKSISEIEEETEQLEAENRKTELQYSVAEKQAMIARLKRDNVNPSLFSKIGGGLDFTKIWNYIKSH
jgi:hypothetical protein